MFFVLGSWFLVAQFRSGTLITSEELCKWSEKPSRFQGVTIERFEDIEGWQLARELTRQVYAVANRGAFAKDRGLRDQITRASGSSMHNIAEGFDGGSNAEFVKYLRYAQRSCSEVQSQLYVALDQTYICKEELDTIYNQAALTHSKVGGFIRYLLKTQNPR